MPGTKPTWYPDPMPETLEDAVRTVLDGYESAIYCRREWDKHRLYRVTISVRHSDDKQAKQAINTAIDRLMESDLSNEECVVVSRSAYPNGLVDWFPEFWTIQGSVDLPVRMKSQGA